MTNDISDEVVDAALEAYREDFREDFRDFDGTLQHEDGLRSAIRAAVLAERKRVIEECAKVADPWTWCGYGQDICGPKIAAAIRALGEK